MPLEKQIREILQVDSNLHSVTDTQVNDTDIIRDISDGVLYKQFVAKCGKPDGKFITLTLNSDGVPVFKSSAFSFWPMLCSVNELPISKRRTNIVMPGLWFGTTKPTFSTFFKPFVSEIKHLRQNGFEMIANCGMIFKLYVTILICTCDSVARCLLQNVKQFNGNYGCNWCLLKGKREKKGKGSVHVYPFVENLTKRSHTNTVEHARSAYSSGDCVYGVKGPSPLLGLPDLNIVDGFVVDYMHCVDLGVTRYLVGLWFDTVHHTSAWYIGRRTSEVNSNLCNIRPPSSITRLPRTLWKSSEWRAFTLFYASVCLRDILPTAFFEHFMLLSESLYLLLLNNISLNHLNLADRYLKQFVRDFKLLYGKQYMTYNIHLLLHLSDSVRNWGPLWCYSNYDFENVNGSLLKMFHGTVCWKADL